MEFMHATIDSKIRSSTIFSGSSGNKSTSFTFSLHVVCMSAGNNMLLSGGNGRQEHKKGAIFS
jgi:hypothetical protein